MPNHPRPDNPHRAIRVEDDLWEASRVAAEAEGTTRAEVMRQALREIVERHDNPALVIHPFHPLCLSRNGQTFAVEWNPNVRWTLPNA